MKAPVAVLDTFLLKSNDFAREPGAKPNFEGIQAMLDIYADTGMISKRSTPPSSSTRRSWRRSSEAVGGWHHRDRAVVESIRYRASRPASRAHGHHDFGRRRAIRLDRRTVGLRQVYIALRRRRICAPDHRPGSGHGQAGFRAGAGPRAGIPGIRAVSLEDRARQRDLRLGPNKAWRNRRRRNARTP